MRAGPLGTEWIRNEGGYTGVGSELGGDGWSFLKAGVGSLRDGAGPPINVSGQVTVLQLPLVWIAASSVHLSSWLFSFLFGTG